MERYHVFPLCTGLQFELKRFLWKKFPSSKTEFSVFDIIKYIVKHGFTKQLKQFANEFINECTKDMKYINTPLTTKDNEHNKCIDRRVQGKYILDVIQLVEQNPNITEWWFDVNKVYRPIIIEEKNQEEKEKKPKQPKQSKQPKQPKQPKKEKVNKPKKQKPKIVALTMLNNDDDIDFDDPF
jgi:hypothetical protein